jgi:hypothetical protein
MPVAVRISDRSVREVLGVVGEIIDRFGPRPAGTAACRRAAADIEARLAPLCDRTGRQEFRVHPDSMWSVGVVIAGLYCLSALMMSAGGAWVWGAAAASTASLAYWINESVIMVGTFDFLFPGKTGVNVWGIVEPEGELRRQIYVVGHHDSPRVLTFLSGWQRLYAVRIFGAIAFSIAQFLTAWMWVSYRLLHHADPVWGIGAAVTGLAGLVFLGPLLFLVGHQASPGAGDNLVASVLSMGVAKAVRGPNGRGRLRHTRLVVLSLDAEEPGMRGAGAYLRAHAGELKTVRTSVLNFDAIYDAPDLRLLGRDRNGLKALSKEMTARCAEVSAKLGYGVKAGPVPFGGGGTDAVRFADHGIEVASIIGISTHYVRDGLIYHTVNDTVDRLDPEAVKICMEIAVNYIVEEDDAA